MAEKYFVYILRSEKDGKRYIGATDDINKRFIQHQKGEVKSTRHRRPLKLVHSEAFDDKHTALMKERFYKSGKGREYLKELDF